MSDDPRDFWPDPEEGLVEAIQDDLMRWSIQGLVKYLRVLYENQVFTDDMFDSIEFEADREFESCDELLTYLNDNPSMKEIAVVVMAGAIMEDEAEKQEWMSELDD